MTDSRPAKRRDTPSGGGHSTNALEVLRKFRLIFRSVKKHFRWVEQRCGVSGAQLWLMWEIHERPRSRVSDIAKALSIHQSTVSNMLDKLERRGLIVRRRSRSDQREVQLRLTARGRAVIALAPGPARGVLTEALNTIPRRSLESLDASLDEVIGAMMLRDEAGVMKPLSDT
jgi:DNA-binding MarR family transcriptional regulator